MTRFAVLFLAVLSTCLFVLHAHAQEKETPPQKTSPPKTSPQQTESPMKAETPKPPAPPPRSGMVGKNPIESILQGMQLSATKVRASDTSPETITAQKQIVKDLDELIKALQRQQQQPPPPSNQQNSQQDQQQNQQQNQSQQEKRQSQPQNSQHQQEAQRQRNQRQNAQTEADRSRESGPRSQNRNQVKPTEGSSAALEKDVWGHLPPSMRRELLNIYREKFIPKYDDMVRKYYEALSEGNRGSETP